MLHKPSFGGSAYGGGIYNGTNGTLTINNSTISANTAGGGGWWCGHVPCQGGGGGGGGGGIANVGQLRINNSTISGNSAFGLQASSSGRGGGVYSGYPGGMMVSNSTVSGNRGTHGGGIYPVGGFQNSIVANNSGQNSNPVTSHGYNLSSDGTCNFNKVGDLNNDLLGPLQNNGGPTDTMALLLGSPAVDAGNPASCKARNNSRGPVAESKSAGKTTVRIPQKKTPKSDTGQ